MDTLNKLKEKNKALSSRRRHLKQWIASMHSELSRGCHNHREVHKKLLKCIEEEALLTIHIDRNGKEITRLRMELKQPKSDEFLTDLTIVKMAIAVGLKQIEIMELSSHITFRNVYQFSQYLTLNNISNRVEHNVHPINGNWEEYVIIFT
jgi:hypothetical protein